MAASGMSSSVATATAASEFKTLWRPGKLVVRLNRSPAGGRQGDVRRLAAGAQRVVMRLEAVAHHVDGANIRLRRETVGEEGTRHGLENAAHLLVVAAQHGQSVKRQVMQEIDEALFEPRQH